MKKNVVLLLISFGLLLWISTLNSVFGQEKRWSDEKLSWSDYKKVIQQSGIHHAFTYSGITFELSSENDTVVIRVYSYFDPGQSWVHPDHRVPALLNHEQLHFDICELYIRKLRKKISETELTILDPGSQIRTAFEQAWTDYQSAQSQYDEDTRHGLIEKDQKRWEKNIVDELRTYEEFATR